MCAVILNPTNGPSRPARSQSRRGRDSLALGADVTRIYTGRYSPLATCPAERSPCLTPTHEAVDADIRGLSARWAGPEQENGTARCTTPPRHQLRIVTMVDRASTFSVVYLLSYSPATIPSERPSDNAVEVDDISRRQRQGPSVSAVDTLQIDTAQTVENRKFLGDVVGDLVRRRVGRARPVRLRQGPPRSDSWSRARSSKPGTLHCRSGLVDLRAASCDPRS
jgi:hypothetical protein